MHREKGWFVRLLIGAALILSLSVVYLLIDDANRDSSAGNTVAGQDEGPVGYPCRGHALTAASISVRTSAMKSPL